MTDEDDYERLGYDIDPIYTLPMPWWWDNDFDKKMEKMKEEEQHIRKIIALKETIRDARRQLFDLEATKPNRWTCYYQQDFLSLEQYEGLIKLRIDNTFKDRSIYLTKEQAKELCARIKEQVGE
jgi:hypothetical protein